jgi:SMODS-associating 4TM effector domain
MADIRLQGAANYFYDRARLATKARHCGLVIFAALPLALFRLPKTAVYVAAISALWFAVELLLLRPFERHETGRGALAQEQFDVESFFLRWNILPPPLSPEVLRWAADACKRPPVEPWYATAGALECQGENTAWSLAIQRQFVLLIKVAVVVLLVVQVAIGYVGDLRFRGYLSVLLVPSVPPLLSLIALYQDHRQVMNDLSEIEDRISSLRSPSLDEIRAIQDATYFTRARFPLVPRFVYRLVKRRRRP